MTEQELRTAGFQSWKSALIAGGITAIVMGLVLLIWPEQTLLVFASLLGIGLILIGIARLAGAAATRDATGKSRVWRAVTGLIYIIAGIVVLANLHGTLRFLVWAIGIIWVISGLFEIFSGISRPSGEKAMTIVFGVMNLAFGLVLLVWPGPTLVFVIWIAGLWLIALGVLQIVFAFMAGKAFKDEPGPKVIDGTTL